MPMATPEPISADAVAEPAAVPEAALLSLTSNAAKAEIVMAQTASSRRHARGIRSVSDSRNATLAASPAKPPLATMRNAA